MDGVGIVDITQPEPDQALVTLTDGREIALELPRGPAGPAGRDGITQTIVKGGGTAPSAGGEGRQEVYIGGPGPLAFPALAFIARLIDGQTVYEMQVNAP